MLDHLNRLPHVQKTCFLLLNTLLDRVQRQHNRLKSKKRPRATSDSVQESGKQKKRVKRLCEENTNSPFTAKKGQKLNTSSHNSPSLPRSIEGVPHQSIMGALQLESDQRQTCTGQHLPLGNQLDSPSTGRTIV